MNKVVMRLRWSSNIDGEAKEKERLVTIEEYAKMDGQELARVEVAPGAKCPCCGTWQPLDPKELQVVLIAGARGHLVEWPPGQGRTVRRDTREGG